MRCGAPWAHCGAAIVVLALSGCGAGGTGEPASGFVSGAAARAYIPLRETGVFGEHFGAAVVIAPGVAVTNAHNANLVAPASVIGRAQMADLLFFRAPGATLLLDGDARAGEAVVCYGQGPDGQLRKAMGIVHRLGPIGFTIMANAGHGFSGGPVLDAADGRLLGITYGYLDVDEQGTKTRLLIAYKTAFVRRTWSALQETAIRPKK